MNQKIHDLSWKETSFWSKLKLLGLSWYKNFPKFSHESPYKKGEAIIAHASTCYSIVGTAKAYADSIRKMSPVKMLTSIFPLAFLWTPLAGFCYWASLWLAQKAYRETCTKRLSADQCDVLQSIFRLHGKYKEAEECIETGLKKPGIDFHTEALLHIGKAYCYRYNSGNPSLVEVETELHLAYRQARLAEETHPAQVSRVYRHIAILLEYCGSEELRPPDKFLKRAKELAEESGAKDVQLKNKTAAL